MHGTVPAIIARAAEDFAGRGAVLCYQGVRAQCSLYLAASQPDRTESGGRAR